MSLIISGKKEKTFLKIGKKIIIPETAEKESWKPMSFFNNKGLKASIKKAMKTINRKELTILPEFLDKRKPPPMIPALMADACIPVMKTKKKRN